MNRTLITYLIILATYLSGCDSQINELNNSAEIAEEMAGPARSSTEGKFDPEAGLPINSCDRSVNKNKGFCGADWIDCPVQDHCEFKKHQNYLSIKSMPNSPGTCSCNVGWLVANGVVKLLYSYDRAGDDEIRLSVRRSWIRSSLIKFNENKYSDMISFAPVPISPSGFSMEVVRECTECSEQSELRVYFLSVNGVDAGGEETAKRIYEIGPMRN